LPFLAIFGGIIVLRRLSRVSSSLADAAEDLLLSASLFLNVGLCSALLRLADIVLLLILGLRALVAGEAGDSSANGAGETISGA
jgi:hypothetical protein